MRTHKYTYETFAGAAENAAPRTYGDAWCGGLSRAQTVEFTRKGDDSNVPKAESLLEKLQANVETPRRRWKRNVAGAFPCVPEYLIGVPDSMRYLKPERDASNPIAVYASIMAPAFEDAERMMTRGIAILSLVLKLQAVRPISLYAVCPWTQTTLIIEIPTKPLSIAHAAFCLSHPAFFRRLGHEVLYATGDSCTSINDDSRVPKILGMKPTDIYIGTGMSTVDWQGTRGEYDDMHHDPVGWINRKIAKIITQ